MRFFELHFNIVLFGLMIAALAQIKPSLEEVDPDNPPHSGPSGWTKH
jgi:hypothetical protein